MKKPNKIERMNAYLYAWAILTGRIQDPCIYDNPLPNYFICVLIFEYHNEVFRDKIGTADVPLLYPELAAQKPKGCGAAWWPYDDVDSRIKALENAVKLLA